MLTTCPPKIKAGVVVDSGQLERAKRQVYAEALALHTACETGSYQRLIYVAPTSKIRPVTSVKNRFRSLEIFTTFPVYTLVFHPMHTMHDCRSFDNADAMPLVHDSKRSIESMRRQRVAPVALMMNKSLNEEVED